MQYKNNDPRLMSEMKSKKLTCGCREGQVCHLQLHGERHVLLGN